MDKQREIQAEVEALRSFWQETSFDMRDQLRGFASDPLLLRKKVEALVDSSSAQMVARQLGLQGAYARKFQGAELFLTKRGAEQATSSLLATWKAELLASEHSSLLFPGHGVGSELLACAGSGIHVIGLERDQELHALLLLSASLLDVEDSLSLQCVSLEDWLRSTSPTSVDAVVLDPDRRNSGARFHTLAESSPSVPLLLPSLYERADYIYVKCSPAQDLQEFSMLPGCSKLWFVQECGELKEIFTLFRKGYAGAVERTLVNVSDRVRSLRIPNSGEDMLWDGHVEDGYVLFEASPALIRSQIAGAVPGAFRVHQSSSLLVGPAEVFTPFVDFGVLWHIEALLPFQKKQLKSYVKGRQWVVKKRFFPMLPGAIISLLGIQEGAGDALLFTTGPDGRIVFHLSHYG